MQEVCTEATSQRARQVLGYEKNYIKFDVKIQLKTQTESMINKLLVLLSYLD